MIRGIITDLKNFLTQQVTAWKTDSITSISKDIIIEEPLSICVQDTPYAVVMRTPGDEIEHVAGFCFAEGVIDILDDFTSIAFRDGANTNLVTVALNQKRERLISQILERRNFIGQSGFIDQTSCGFCGKEVVENLSKTIQSIAKDVVINWNKALNCMEDLSQHQPMRARTKASHAAALYSFDYKLLAVAEDVGRHNALDKAVGKLFLKGILEDASILILSSRISYELVQKAARAKIPVILSVSRPTSLAVQLASRLNITLACLAPKNGLYIFNA